MLHPISQKKSIWLILTAIALLVVACTPDNGGSGNIPVDRPEETAEPTTEPQPEQITMFVGPELVECVGIAPQTCLQIKFEANADWQLLYDGIEGFEHEAGYEYELLVNKYQVENAPADASNIRYELVEIVSQSTAETAVMDNLDFLLNTNWDLVTMNGDAPVQGSTPTLSFDGESLNGTTGCNSYFGPFTLDGTELSIEFLGQTEIACELDLDVQEQNYLRMLMSAVSLTLENETLTIHTAEGDLIYQPASQQALEGTAWNLTAIATDNAMVSTRVDEFITAEFLDGRLSGNAGCNSYGTAYETSGSNITLGEIETTLMACEDEEVMARESEFLAALKNVDSFEIVRNNLTFYDADGNVVMTFIAYV